MKQKHRDSTCTWWCCPLGMMCVWFHEWRKMKSNLKVERGDGGIIRSRRCPGSYGDFVDLEFESKKKVGICAGVTSFRSISGEVPMRLVFQFEFRHHSPKSQRGSKFLWSKADSLYDTIPLALQYTHSSNRSVIALTPLPFSIPPTFLIPSTNATSILLRLKRPHVPQYFFPSSHFKASFRFCQERRSTVSQHI